MACNFLNSNLISLRCLFSSRWEACCWGKGDSFSPPTLQVSIFVWNLKLACVPSHLRVSAQTRNFILYYTEPTCQCRRLKRHGFNPWVGKMPWSRKWQPTPVFWPGESMDKVPSRLGNRSCGYLQWKIIDHRRNKSIEVLMQHMGVC